MDKIKVFMIMPFQDQFFEVYEMLKMEFADSFEFSNAGDEGNQQNILKDIIQPIYEADVVIADLTGLNPNVMYELGLAHSLDKKTIIITQDDLSKLPFDLKQYRAKDYSIHFKKFAELIATLKTNLNGVIDGSVIYSNPVRDFLSIQGIKGFNCFDEKAVVLEDDSDKGFIDFLADIETSAEQLTADIVAMNKDMKTMTAGANESVKEIERVQKTGGSGTASFVRKQTKKVAGHIEDFDRKLKDHNAKISQVWNEIEKNTMGLIENRFASKAENKEPLINYLFALHEMKISVSSTQKPMDNLIASMDNCLGLERSMNQAIRFVKEDLSVYQNVTERMCISIDKILTKARFVVGDIDFESADRNLGQQEDSE